MGSEKREVTGAGPGGSAEGFDGGGCDRRRDTERDTLVSALEVRRAGGLAADCDAALNAPNRPTKMILPAFPTR